MRNKRAEPSPVVGGWQAIGIIAAQDAAGAGVFRNQVHPVIAKARIERGHVHPALRHLRQTTRRIIAQRHPIGRGLQQILRAVGEAALAIKRQVAACIIACRIAAYVQDAVYGAPENDNLNICASAAEASGIIEA